MTTYPASQSVKEVLGCDDLTACFTELVLWYDGFENQERMKALPFEKQDLEIIISFRNQARHNKDWKTSDFLRDVLVKAGCVVKDK